MEDDDDEMIDADELLDEEDKQKPTSESLRVCSTTGKRKACKDCSCGLAEELDAEAKGDSVDVNPTQKSSCGSVSVSSSYPILIRLIAVLFPVLSRRCLQMLDMPIPWSPCLQTRREDSTH